MKAKTMARTIAMLLAPALLAGCATAARDTTGFSLTHSATVPVSMMDAWQVTKAVLREHDLEIYTRDKRGRFEAYSQSGRRMMSLQRVRHNIELVEHSPGETTVYIDTVRQVYGVTLTTYPDWHDRMTTDDRQALAILDEIQAKISGQPAVVTEAEEIAQAY